MVLLVKLLVEPQESHSIVKKWSAKRRKWNKKHSYKLGLRKVASKVRAKRARRHLQGIPHERRRLESPRVHKIITPVNLSFEENRDAIIELVSEIRNISSKRSLEPYIDFRPIREIAPSGALILVAELDRWNKLKTRFEHRLNTADVKLWKPLVRHLLGQLGFFQLISANYPERLRIDDESMHRNKAQYIKFRTGSKLDGETIERFRRDDLEPLLGTLPNARHFYGAVIEAMTNVDHHAYEHSGMYPNWWLSGAVDTDKNVARIMLFDQGVGIPETLPMNFSERAVSLLGDNHAKMIEAAHTLGRSASNDPNRGLGLKRDVQNYLDVMDSDGTYKVSSLRGEYTVEKRNGKVLPPTLKNHRSTLPGTLIEWRVLL